MDRPPPVAWPVPAVFPSLGPTDVHVWCGWLDDPQMSDAAASAALSTDEAARAAAFRFPTDRQRFVAAHALVREVLGRYLGVHPATLALTKTVTGKPAVTGGDGLEFNLSHSGALCLVAVAHQPVGVDVEQRWELPDLATLEGRMFTPAALRRQQRCAPGPRLHGFYRRWTQLEAAGKCRGVGLDLDHLAPLTEHLAPCDPAAGFTGSVACARPPGDIAFLQFAPGIPATPPGRAGNTHPRLPELPHRQPPLVRLSSS